MKRKPIVIALIAAAALAAGAWYFRAPQAEPPAEAVI